MEYKERNYAKEQKPEVDPFWIICPVCGFYMNDPKFDPHTGKAYHKWCLPTIKAEGK